MKIIPSSSSKTKKIDFPTLGTKKKSSTQASFLQLIDHGSDEPILETLFSEPEQLLNNISLIGEELDKLGKELAEKPLPETFFRYKKHIRVLLKGAGRNMEMKETTARSGLTRTKLFYTVQIIDQMLGELADKILNDEKNRIEILKLTNHLKGLILDILA
ncbi:MAG: DUF327 family protein [Brevinemataceae bacterium]